MQLLERARLYQRLVALAGMGLGLLLLVSLAALVAAPEAFGSLGWPHLGMLVGFSISCCAGSAFLWLAGPDPRGLIWLQRAWAAGALALLLWLASDFLALYLPAGAEPELITW